MARARLTAMQAHHCSSEGALSSLEEAIGDKEKQMTQLREQRDRAEQEKQEERELHERELAEYKMKLHALESEVSASSASSKWWLMFHFLIHWFSVSGREAGSPSRASSGRERSFGGEARKLPVRIGKEQS